MRSQLQLPSPLTASPTGSSPSEYFWKLLSDEELVLDLERCSQGEPWYIHDPGYTLIADLHGPIPVHWKGKFMTCSTTKGLEIVLLKFLVLSIGINPCSLQHYKL